MIIFENNGEIDVRSITTFGVSSKDSSNAIGFFGTGLKYAIAILLREDCSITIYSGKERYEFTKKTEKLRNDEFDFVYMNGQQLGFTTELGKTWRLWQAFRELYCNCKDENGTAYSSNSFSPLGGGLTRVIVEGEAFEDIFRQKEEYIIEAPLEEQTPYGEIQSGTSSDLFYKGIRVYTNEDTPFLNKYNIFSDVDLTEDRTVKHEFDINYWLCKMLLTTNNKQIIERVITCGNDNYEYRLRFTAKGIPSDAFRGVVNELLKDKTKEVNKSALEVCGVGKYDQIEIVPVEGIDKVKMEKAIDFLVDLGHNITRYPIHVATNLGAGIHGLAKTGNIYISPLCFDKGTKYIAATLLEEYLHLRHGFHDCTYDFQNHLFDMIISLGEELRGEPL